MEPPPKGWRVHHGRDPEQERRRLTRRLRAVSRHLDHAAKLRRFYRWAKIAALVACGAVAVYLTLASLGPWPPMVALKHLAASPNCAAARAVGLAPANRGEPGYWPQHDRDGDGQACEPWPRGEIRGDRDRRRRHLWRP